ncbi:hypothetical protein [cf. Phormidesmis sp. LEGE 11477]|uniref:hypothetical protein n=1 Tax=cf. Phormidesmis sp. LEGE 11477 TaxID=1828680 RepID=UPI00188110C2|nr:hypothetical protein [cf. Phormidesmis sp. LEGE 11477]MBE9060330.1 hypothetical protein [cf. Phormidesmis sp. LEGE 11477]
MSDHKSVQETESTAAGKVSEALEATRRLLMQQRGEDTPKNGSEAKLRESFQKAYQENGVDEPTAAAAARDAALGLGSKDSPAMAKAEDMAVAGAQAQAKEYRQVTEKAADPEAPEAERQQATARRREIEQNLGIRNQPIEVKAQTINSLDPQQTAQNQQAETNPLSVKRKALSPEQAELKTDYQEKLEKGGVLPQTAEPASYDMATGRGAKDSRYVAAAQQELQRHQILKNMYQGIYEKHGVSPEVAATAADQLARGSGANRSPEVRKAHEQALNNINYAQQVSARQSSQPTRSSKNVSKETTAAQPALGRQTSQKTAIKDRQQISQQQTSADKIWAKFSPGENGVFQAMAKGNAAMQRLSDQSVAKDALLAGHEPLNIQKAIAQNSAHAKTLEHPRDYARTTVKKAEASPEVKEKQAQDEKRAATLKARPSRKEAQKSQVNSPIQTRNKPRQKAKGKDRGMSY